MPVMLGALLVLGLLHLTLPAAAAQSRQGSPGQRVGSIRVWSDREHPYRRGAGARIYLRTEQAGYVTVLRVDTDGRIRTLFPRDPWGNNYARGGRTMALVPASSQRESFRVDDDPGVGYLFAVISSAPFEYHDVTRGDYWDFRVIDDGRIQGDPYVALTDLARRIVPRGNFQYDIAPYYVERHYEYPRFVCYDCHAYARFDEWDPYAASCIPYRMVIYDDPAYYPYRYNQGRNVVVGRPIRPAPRFVFKNADPGREYVTRVRQRESHEMRWSRIDRDRTTAKVGRPTIPTPNVAPGFRGRAESGPILRRDIGRPAPAAVPPRDVRPAGRDRQKVPPVQRGARNPQSTGEPELRRRKPETR